MLTYKTIQKCLTVMLYQIYLKLRNSFPYKMSHLFVIFSLGEDLKGHKSKEGSLADHRYGSVNSTNTTNIEASIIVSPTIHRPDINVSFTSSDFGHYHVEGAPLPPLSLT